MNSFGRKFRVSIFGESHGESVGVIIDGVPPGIPLCQADFTEDITRRRGGKGATQRVEKDIPHFVSGVFNGYTTGAPLAITFLNENMRSADYSPFNEHPRPSHADWVAQWRFCGFADYRGGGHFSGRMTLALVAAGVIAKRIVEHPVAARAIEIGGQSDPARFEEVIDEAMKSGDSVGGVIECRVDGLRAGLGEPFFDSAESVISHALFSVPAVKGVEFGLGFGSARLPGSENNDPIIAPDGTTATNNAGGICGGMTNNNPLILRVAVKPTPSIAAPQMTLNTSTGKIEELRIHGRHDACIAMRAPVVVEAAVAIALADLILLHN